MFSLFYTWILDTDLCFTPFIPQVVPFLAVQEPTSYLKNSFNPTNFNCQYFIHSSHINTHQKFSESFIIFYPEKSSKLFQFRKEQGFGVRFLKIQGIPYNNNNTGIWFKFQRTQWGLGYVRPLELKIALLIHLVPSSVLLIFNMHMMTRLIWTLFLQAFQLKAVKAASIQFIAAHRRGKLKT